MISQMNGGPRPVDREQSVRGPALMHLGPAQALIDEPILLTQGRLRGVGQVQETGQGSLNPVPDLLAQRILQEAGIDRDIPKHARQQLRSSPEWWMLNSGCIRLVVAEHVG